jgi:hypothetical protein
MLRERQGSSFDWLQFIEWLDVLQNVPLTCRELVFDRVMRGCCFTISNDMNVTPGFG